MKHSIRTVVTWFVLGSASAGATGPEKGPDFDRTVAPLLVKACLDCHTGPKPKGRLDLGSRAGVARGGKNGPAVEPGKPDDSLLWQRVRDGEMPPKKPLTRAEQATLRAWIESGAGWGSDPIDPFRFTSASRAGYDWWSLRPVKRPPVPGVGDPGWAKNPIDRFILARLEANRLRPSPEADRRTLIRRLSFDLLGLPPGPDEVAAFLADPSPLAYEHLVDRYLASPQYGVRWARHWLDVVRFGESNGFERDLPRPFAWPYRDWVVRALNQDVPYDEFVRLQLAGDVVRPGDSSAVVATGYLVAGPHDTVIPASDLMRQSMQQDEMEDLIGTTGQTFLGLTVNCARCHDHKFDPVSQKDYYRLVACFAGVQPGDRAITPDDHGRLARLRRQLDGLKRDLAALEEPAVRAVLEHRRGSASKLPVPRPLAEWQFNAGPADRVGGLDGTLFGTAAATPDGLRLDGATGYVATDPLRRNVREKTLEAWVRLDGLAQRGGGVISLQTRDGIVFDAVVFAELEPGRWMAGSNFFKRTESFQGAVEPSDSGVVHVAITYAGDGTVTAYRNGLPYGRPYKTSGPVTYKAGEANVLFGLRHAPTGNGKLLKGWLVRARLHDRALTPDEVAASAGVESAHVSDAELIATLAPDQRGRREDLARRIAGATAEHDRYLAGLVTKVYAVAPVQPGKTHLLVRGNVADPAEEVTAGPTAAVSAAFATGPADIGWGLTAATPEGERRARLARWITDPANPLTARVMVNRLWHYHFGTGVVETPNDFGFNGGRPSHPELLDWLASDFVDHGWSQKALHRTIVTSAAYRQGARRTPADAAKIDANNRLVWTHAPQRLGAEAVRDAMLAVGGTLDLTVGGQGFQDFNSYFFKGTQFYDPVEQVGPKFYRRSLYRMWARGGRNPFLDTFDCPDPSTTTPRRAVTTTPLQALALLNNAFALHMADVFAARLRAEAGDDPGRQIARAYELAFARPAEPKELAAARPFVARHGLPAFCRVLFNSNEFIHVD